MWENPTALVTQARVQIIATAGFVALVGDVGNEAAHVHYPIANPEGIDSSTKDAIPLVLVTERSVSFQRYAEGAGGLRNGMLELTFVMPVGGAALARTVGQAEDNVATICQQLLQQQPGANGLIPFKGSVEIETATSPTPGAEAVDTAGNPAAFRTVIARLPYGLTA